MLTPTIAALSDLTWQGAPVSCDYDPERQRLSITARAGTDWFNNPLTGARDHSAAALLFDREGDFTLSARVSVGFGDTFDAGVLCLRQSEEQWAKLCFEYSPQGQPMVVSVVTRDLSDDANSVVVGSGSVYLRVARIGSAYAFHYSQDGSYWHFVRLFRLGGPGAAMRVGFLAQAPGRTDCTSTFEAITLTRTTLGDLRSGG
jgi:regulation of enolase protein 1 (concanavalin A-like superfamily)